VHDIRLMKAAELNDTLELIRNVFSEFEAPDYEPEGVETFFAFSEETSIKESIASGELKFWICKSRRSLAGALAVKNGCHICMLFVDKRFHRQGIATRLLEAAFSGTDSSSIITVNSSPYGVPFYHAAGFSDTSPLTVKNGIKYVPMSAKRSELFAV